MGTYDYKKILADYASGKISVEQAMGHTLQHIDKLYELQATANVNRYKLRGRLDKLDKTVSTLQAEIIRLTILIEKVVSK